jgi:hypothetical protein
MRDKGGAAVRVVKRERHKEKEGLGRVSFKQTRGIGGKLENGKIP